MSPLIKFRSTKKKKDLPVLCFFWGTHYSAHFGFFAGRRGGGVLLPSVRAAFSVKLAGTDKGQQNSLRQTKLKEICLFLSARSLGSGRFAPLTSPILQLSALHFSPDFAALAGFYSLLVFSFLFFFLSLPNMKVPPLPSLNGA